MTQTGNPFAQMMISFDPERFYGRRNETELILRGVTSREPRSFAVHGARMIGKTALLKYLCDPNGAASKYAAALVDFGPGLAGTLAFLYIDCYHVRSGTLLPTLYEKTLTVPELKRAANSIVLEVHPSFTLPEIKEALLQSFRALHEQDIRLTICLDHFDLAFQTMEYEDDAFLRHLTRFQPFITATEESLPELKQGTNITSPLLNILMSRNIGLLTDTEARELIQHPATDAGLSFQTSEVEFILKTAGRHPYLLTAVCESLFDWRQQHPELEQLVPEDVQRRQKVRFRLLAQPAVEEFLLFHWGHLTEAEQEVLAGVANGQALVLGTSQSSLRALREKSLIYEDLHQDRYVVFADLLSEFTQGRHTHRSQDILGSLSPNDRRLFEYLLARPNQVSTFEELKLNVWQDPSTSKRSLESAIHRLRKTLAKPVGDNWGTIENIRGTGYQYTPGE